MSNIITEKEELLYLSDTIKYISQNEINKSYLEEILKQLLPKKNGETLIKDNISENGITTAVFSPRNNSIKISINKINEWLELNSKELSEMYKTNDINTLKSFLFLFVITHEIEHSYQYLISNGIIKSPSEIIKQGYKGIFDLLLPDKHIIPRPIKETRRKVSLMLYKSNENFLILERNANIESTDLLIQLATFMEREDILNLFKDIQDIFIEVGYTENNKGSMDETYRKILLYDKYKKFYEETNLKEEDKIRLGLNISEEARQKILKK